MEQFDILLNNPLFWIVFFLIGYTAVIVVLGLPEILTKIENRVPKILIRISIFFIFIVPPVILPFIEGPNLSFLLTDISVNTFRLNPFESEQNFSAITAG